MNALIEFVLDSMGLLLLLGVAGVAGVFGFYLMLMRGMERKNRETP